MSDGTYSKRKVFDPKTMSVKHELVRTGEAPKPKPKAKAAPKKAAPKGEGKAKAAPKRRRLRRKKNESPQS